VALSKYKGQSIFYIFININLTNSMSFNTMCISYCNLLVIWLVMTYRCLIELFMKFFNKHIESTIWSFNHFVSYTKLLFNVVWNFLFTCFIPLPFPKLVRTWSRAVSIRVSDINNSISCFRLLVKDLFAIKHRIRMSVHQSCLFYFFLCKTTYCVIYAAAARLVSNCSFVNKSPKFIYCVVNMVYYVGRESS